MKESLGKALCSDSKVIEAKKLLLEAVSSYRNKITEVKPPHPELKIRYEEYIKAFSLIRGANLWYPYLGSGLGNGSLVELLDGSVKYDMITGIGVHFFGHSCLDLIDSSIESALSNTVLEGNLQQNLDSLEFAELLTNASGMAHCFLTSSGAMANENALKVAFQKNTPAKRILAFDRCFAGRTFTFSQITDKPSFRQGLPLNLPVDYIPYYDPEKPEESTAQAIAALKKHIYRYPKEYAVMIFELIQGEGGFHYGTSHFFKSLMEILKEHKIAVFADEIQTFGRTSELFAFQHFGLEELIDICTIGKLSLCCATLFTEAYRPQAGLLSQTFTSAVSCIKGGKKVVQKLLEGHFFGENGRNMGVQNRFKKHLHSIQERYPGIIHGPFGIGGMIAFTPFDGSLEKATQVAQRLFDEGVITFIAGNNPTRVRMLPPIGSISNDEIDSVMKIIEHTLIHI